MFGEFVLDDAQVRERLASWLPGGAVDDMDDGLAALDVTKKIVAETASLAGALDETGHISDGERGLAGHHDAQVRDQRGEGVVGDLGLGCRDRRDQA